MSICSRGSRAGCLGRRLGQCLAACTFMATAQTQLIHMTSSMQAGRLRALLALLALLSPAVGIRDAQHIHLPRNCASLSNVA